MPEEYGADDYSEDVYGGSLERSIEQRIDDFLPAVLPLDDETRIITRYVDAHDTEMEGYDAATSYVTLSRYVLDAEGDDLDRVGRLFGPLGSRGTRDRGEYRTYLSNLINSFNARGTLSGLRFAIAAAASTEPENIIINEDFVNNEYEISIVQTDSEFLSGAINDLAELADPSAVELSAPPIIVTAGDELFLDATESAVIETTTGLGAETLTMDGNSQLTGTL